MEIYLVDESIINIFDSLIYQLDKCNLGTQVLYSDALRRNIEFYFGVHEDLIIYDELGLIDIRESLNSIKDNYCNSFCEDNHLELVLFVSDIVHDLNDPIEFEELYSKVNNEILSNNLKISCENGCNFIGELLCELDDKNIILNVIKMYKSFQDLNRVDMVKERMKDALFLYKSARYTACLALVAFALEGFLRGIFSDRYEELEEEFKILNARLEKTSDGTKPVINFTDKLKPTIDFSSHKLEPSKRIDLNVRKVRENGIKSVIELKINSEYAGLICSTETITQTKSKKYNFDKLIEKAKTDKLIDDKVFLYESFDFLRKVRNNIVHFDNEHREITQPAKARKIILKIVDFININIYKL